MFFHLFFFSFHYKIQAVSNQNSFFFITILRTLAKESTGCHSSLERFEYLNDFWLSVKIYFSNWLRKTPILGWPKGGSQVVLGLKVGLSLKNGMESFYSYSPCKFFKIRLKLRLINFILCWWGKVQYLLKYFNFNICQNFPTQGEYNVWAKISNQAHLVCYTSLVLTRGFVTMVFSYKIRYISLSWTSVWKPIIFF